MDSQGKPPAGSPSTKSEEQIAPISSLYSSPRDGDEQLDNSLADNPAIPSTDEVGEDETFYDAEEEQALLERVFPRALNVLLAQIEHRMSSQMEDFMATMATQQSILAGLSHKLNKDFQEQQVALSQAVSTARTEIGAVQKAALASLTTEQRKKTASAAFTTPAVLNKAKER